VPERRVLQPVRPVLQRRQRLLQRHVRGRQHVSVGAAARRAQATAAASTLP
jgi:hypothetical protein